MLLETFDMGVDPRQAQIVLGLVLGLAFGAAAYLSRFCLRRAVAGETAERRPAAGVWLTGLAAAVLGVQALSAAGFVDLGGHRWLSAELSVLALVAGGLAFGVGMVLTRGCVSRLTVLAPSGNLRAILSLVVFAIVAHATLKGVLAPLRTTLGSVTLDSPVGSLADLPGGGPLWAALLAIPLLAFALRSGARPGHLVLGAAIGLIAAAGWAFTSVLLLDEFDPQPVQSVAFTLPWSDTLFWTIASTAIPATFGVGFISGVFGGSFLAALFRGELRLESFETPSQTLRYGLGAALMGVGGVLAGGCTVGAGIAGGATLSVAALIALASIVAGGRLARALIADGRAPAAAPSAA